METFDLLEYQQQAREILCPLKLFKLWEDVCWRYDHHEISSYELDEMKAVIWPKLKALCSLRRLIDTTQVRTSTVFGDKHKSKLWSKLRQRMNY